MQEATNAVTLRGECFASVEKQKIVSGDRLKRGSTKSCGCILRVIDITGLRVGRLVVLERAGKDKHGSAQWMVLCDCGVTKIVRGINLRAGTKSCGCLNKENIAALGRKHAGHKYSFKHGHARPGANSPTYSSFLAMKKRCFCPSAINYSKYVR